MMNARRSFLALVGGAVFNGAVLRPAAAAVPTLILPPSASLPSARPLLAAHGCQMDAFLEIGRHVPKGTFLDWLENGLQLAERHRRSPADLVSEEEAHQSRRPKARQHHRGDAGGCDMTTRTVPLTIADQGEAELIGLYRQMSAEQRRAVGRFVLRNTNGMPFAVALARLRTELARARPNGGRPT